MVGGYPTAPEQRLAYDLDGSEVFRLSDTDGAFLLKYDSASIENLNNEHSGTNVSETGTGHGFLTTWLFPGPRDLFAVWASGGGDEAIENFFINVATSPDTRSWNSGTWTNTGAGFTECARIWDTWRTDIQTFSRTNQWGFRGTSGGRGGLEFIGKILRQVHIYGDLHDPAYPDRIIVLDKSTGLELDLYDWGYLHRGTSKTKEVQVQNNSTTNQATGVSLAFDSLNTHDPDTWHELSDGGAFSSSLNIGAIAPGTIHPSDITIKVTAPSTAGMGPWTNRLVVGVEDWVEAISELDGEAIGGSTTSGAIAETIELDGEATGVGEATGALDGGTVAARGLNPIALQLSAGRMAHTSWGAYGVGWIVSD